MDDLPLLDDLPYGDLTFPPPPPDRPYVFTNMVTTIDGKSVSGGAQEDVSDLGSRFDREVMRRLERRADAIMAGGRTVRASSFRWNPETPVRIVVTRSGEIPSESRFIREGTTYLATGTDSPARGDRVLRIGTDGVDFAELLQKVRTELAIQRLLVAGGSELNAELLKLDLVDEVFWTIAPKIKLGRDLPGYAGGEAFPRGSLLAFDLIEHRAVGSEIFARYRRCRKPA